LLLLCRYIHYQRELLGGTPSSPNDIKKLYVSTYKFHVDLYDTGVKIRVSVRHIDPGQEIMTLLQMHEVETYLANA